MPNPQRSYRAHLIPPGTPPEHIETLAAAGGLRAVRVRARNCTAAMVAAHRVTGLPVHSAERVEGGAV